MRLAVLLFVAILAPGTALADGTSVPRWEQLPLPPPMPTPDATGVVESHGAQIYFARFGVRFGDGEPVILLHGGMGSGDHWSHQVTALAGSLHVIAIDGRGQGRSTRSKSKPSYDVMALDVLAVMDHLKLQRASIVGWSDGGEIALKLAVHHPKRVGKLFVFGANYDAKGSKKRSGSSKTFAAYSAKCRADYRKLSKTPNQYAQVVTWLLPIWKSPMGFSKDQLKGITAPTLIADGEHDEIIKLEHIEEMSRLIPNARLHVFEDTSHFALWQDPTSFNDVLVAFLTAVKPT